MGDDAWFKSTRRTFLFLVVTLWKKIIVSHANGTHWKKASAVMVKANIVQISDAWMTVVNVGRVLKMSKISVLYMAVDYEDADHFLMKLFNKTCNKTSIMQFNRRTLILETETCTVGVFIIMSPYRTKTLRGAASYFLQSGKPFRVRISRINELYDSLQYKNLWLGINAKKITEEQIIKLLIYGDAE